LKFIAVYIGCEGISGAELEDIRGRFGGDFREIFKD
jgi:hypothetical protein